MSYLAPVDGTQFHYIIKHLQVNGIYLRKAGNRKKSCPSTPSAGCDICPADGGDLPKQTSPPFFVRTAGSREVPEGTSGFLFFCLSLWNDKERASLPAYRARAPRLYRGGLCEAVGEITENSALAMISFRQKEPKRVSLDSFIFNVSFF